MSTTTIVLILFFVCVVGMIFLITKCKLNAVLALLFATLVLAIGLTTVTDAKLASIEGTISSGFSSTIKSIVIIIFLGCLLGKLLEETGAAQAITLSIVKLVGKKNVIWAIAFSGFILGIPIFSDTVTILLIPIVSNLALETGASMMQYGAALGVGAQITHALVAPTPGPLAAAALLGVPLSTAIPWGIIVSFPGCIASTIFCKQMKPMVLPKQEYVDAYNADKEVKLPGTAASFAPIVVPLILIVSGTIINLQMPDTFVGDFFAFIGSPLAALLTGCILAWILTGPRKTSKLVLNDWVDRAMESAAMPLFVTGMGGALAQFIKDAKIAETIAEAIVGASIPGIFVPIVISVLVHVITGSTTLAVATAGALCLPMIETLGITPLATFLAVSSAGMMFKHGNSSAFWVCTSLSNMSFTQGLIAVGGGCTVASIVCCIVTVILSFAGIV